ncbi:MAG: hypothetical protein EBT00_14190 [Proteobacteria bacterium]|jgi:hypothetical protein|nr:hypothetical protein [Pseudomonadota bacterium]NBT19897.1 hypothetical protein [Pseudomonadota bacterium]
MTNKLPDSFVVQQFRDFVDHLDTELSQTLTEIETLKTEDPEYGYARAVGYARARIQSMQISSQVLREFYLDA